MLSHSDAPPETLGRSLYLCPRSGAPLLWSGPSALVPGTDISYPVVEGCAQFCHGPSSGDPEIIARVRRALAIAPARGWRSAIDDAYSAASSSHRYLTDPARSDYVEMLPLSGDSRVLEIGCSMGQHTVQLARRCGMLHAIDVVLEQALFTKKRCRQEGATNVSVACAGDDGLLPFADSSFDVVVLNLVLEWCASRSSESPADLQSRFLREVCRVLSPGGVLFLSTKNRFALSLILGRRDEHLHGMRFGSALPRFFAAWLLRRRGIPRPAGLLHSRRGLDVALSRAGFADLEFLWAIPEFRYPIRFAPSTSKAVRSVLRMPPMEWGPSRLYRLLLPILPVRLVPHVTPGLTVLARKQ